MFALSLMLFAAQAFSSDTIFTILQALAELAGWKDLGMGVCVDNTGMNYKQYMLVSGQFGFDGTLFSCQTLCSQHDACISINFAENYCHLNVNPEVILIGVGHSVTGGSGIGATAITTMGSENSNWSCHIKPAALIYSTPEAMDDYIRVGRGGESFASGSLGDGGEPIYCSYGGNGPSRVYDMHGIHCFNNINSGTYGNDHSWIPGSSANPFVGFLLHGLWSVKGFCVSRDNTGVYTDRANDVLTFQVATKNKYGTGPWETVGSIFRNGVSTRLCFELAMPVDARRVRMQTNNRDTCIDELEVYAQSGKRDFKDDQKAP